MGIVILVWMIVFVIQSILSLGTAYRYTKKGGDNGIALYGWLFVFELASLVPGLGFYMWHKSRERDEDIFKDN